MLSTPLTGRSSMSVNAASGNLMLTSNDMQIAGVAGLDFSSIRTWNSLNLETVEEYGPWSDSNYNLNHLAVQADGNLAMEKRNWRLGRVHPPVQQNLYPPAGNEGRDVRTGKPQPVPENTPGRHKIRADIQR